MKKTIIASMLAIALMQAMAEVPFDDWADGRTLRLDYILAGNDSTAAIYLEEAAVADGWAGRRHNLDKPFVAGNGDIVVRDAATGDTLYANSFSTLFLEWQHTSEAKKVAKAFETTMLVPMPQKAADITLSLYDNRGNATAQLTHQVDPADILIRKLAPVKAETRTLHQAADADHSVNIVVIGDGYTAEETEKFFADAQRASEALLSHEPFASMADLFSLVAVATPSAESGTAIPGQGIWPVTPHRSHFDTFYTDRYLTTQSIHSIWDSVAGVPAEHIILLVNTPKYGGAGILNQITICSADHPTFKPVLVHEFGHAYAGLADEYGYGDDFDTTYALDSEPWEPNITTLVDFDSKWADMMGVDGVGLYEGAGYRGKGIYRPVDECRMRVNSVEHFCPVCSRAIERITRWYTE